MPDKYDIVANTSESAYEPDKRDASRFGFNQEILLAHEVRRMQIANPLLCVDLTATLNAGRVLDLLKMFSLGEG